ncbi:MAG: response regulator transcription factor [Candidatus Accumulibacter sp.]|nr:response regulator transcription factor [Accumulibacter sp.]
MLSVLFRAGGTLESIRRRDAGIRAITLSGAPNLARNPGFRYSLPKRQVGRDMRIAYLEEDAEGAASIGAWLREAGHEVRRFASGMECARAVVSGDYDACLLGRSTGDLSGIEVMARLRIKLRQAMPPVLFVTGNADEQEVVEALDAGADDYLAKPFSRAVLLARLQAVLRRATAGGGLAQTQDFGRLVVDHDRRRISLDGRAVSMTEREADLALYFFRNIDRLLTREHLVKVVWALSGDVDTRTVDVHVSALRRKIGITPEFGWRLVSVYGHGYRLERLDEQPAGPPCAVRRDREDQG